MAGQDLCCSLQPACALAWMYASQDTSVRACMQEGKGNVRRREGYDENMHDDASRDVKRMVGCAFLSLSLSLAPSHFPSLFLAEYGTARYGTLCSVPTPYGTYSVFSCWS